MKRAKMWLGLLAVCGIVSGTADAEPVRRESVVSGGVTWSYSLIGEKATVTGADPADGVLEIPSVLGGYPVGSVGYRAFASCEELVRVVVPAGVGSIGERAFQYCSALEGVSLPAGMTNIGAMAFQYCGSLESVELPPGVGSIGERAFQYCTALEGVSLPAGMTNIGAMAFQYCGSLESVELPQSVEDIGTNAFYRCDGLKKLYAPMLWWDTAKVATAGVGNGCTVVYGEPGKATLVFDANGGVCATPGRGYAPSEPYGWLPEATKENYSFEGWWTATNGGTRVTATDTAPASEGSHLLYARWAPLTQSVTFDASGGTCDTTNRVYGAGEPYSPLPTASREHYDFAGWWTSSWGGTNITEETLVTTNATRTLYAHWTLVQQAVTFDSNGGTCVTTGGVFAVGGAYKLLPKATREGYDFDGWFTACDGGDRLSGASEVPSWEYRTLYAHWTLVEQMVFFWAHGGSCATSNHSYTVGASYGWLPEATREGIAFEGWFDVFTGERVETSDEVTVVRFRTLYARWGTEAKAAKVAAYTPDAGAGTCTVNFQGRAGVTYDLQRRQKMESGAWTTVATKVAEADGDITMATEMPEGWVSGFCRVVAEGEGGADAWLYLVVDMSRGRYAERWPVTYLDGEPDGGWTDEYKTEKLVLRMIPPGAFVMGSPANERGRSAEEVQHTVALTKPFYMGVFEVTQRQWELAMGGLPSYCSFTNRIYYAARPVDHMHYSDIRSARAESGWAETNAEDTTFLGVLRAKTGLEFDLPTEAQWEYACRAGTTTALNSGKDLTEIGSCTNMSEVGRYYYNGGGSESCDTSAGTAKVGSYRPNAWGLYDMHGNVCEWCLDWYGSYDTEGAVDPAGYASGSDRVQRGGCFLSPASDCRSANRDHRSPFSIVVNFDYVGLRLCCPAGPP